MMINRRIVLPHHSSLYQDGRRWLSSAAYSSRHWKVNLRRISTASSSERDSCRQSTLWATLATARGTDSAP